MNLRKKTILVEDTLFERSQKKLKFFTFTLIHELLEVNAVSTWVYIILLVFENFQLLFYSFHENIPNLWDGEAMIYFRGIKYIQLETAFRSKNVVSILIGLLFAAFGIEIVLILILGAVLMYNVKKKNSTSIKYFNRFLSLFAILLVTILTIPGYQIFISVLYCHEESPLSQGFSCYSNGYQAYTIIAGIGIIILTIFISLFGYLFVELRFLQKVPFACPQSWANLARICIKIALPIYMTIDWRGDYSKYYIGVLTVYYIALLGLRYRSGFYYNALVNDVYIGGESILCWVSACSFITAMIDNDQPDNEAVIYVIAGMPMIAIIVIILFRRKKERTLLSCTKALQKSNNIELYIFLLLDLIEKRNQAPNKIKLEGILRYHIKFCQKTDLECPCMTLANTNKKQKETAEMSQQWYLLVKSILNEALAKHPKSSTLHLLYAFIQKEKLKNYHKSWFEIIETEQNKPSIQEEFLCFRYKTIIEMEIKEYDKQVIESVGVDLNTILNFQTQFVEFQSSIDRTVNLHLDFWRELMEQKPDVSKLENLGWSIMTSFSLTENLFNNMVEINPNNGKILIIFGNFIKDIMGETANGKKLISKGTQLQNIELNQFYYDKKYKLGENSNPCIIQISGNPKTSGQITNVNNELWKLLGFTKSELIGQGVEKIMPKIIGDVHNQFVSNFFEHPTDRVMNKERSIYALSKSGHIEHGYLTIKILPSLENGIEIVGFIRTEDEKKNETPREDQIFNEETYYVLFHTKSYVESENNNDSEGLIYGVSKNCDKDLGISSSLVYGSNSHNQILLIGNICPELFEKGVMEQARSAKGIKIALDTTYIKDNYLLDENSIENEDGIIENPVRDESLMMSENSDIAKYNKKKYKKIKIRANIVDAFYFPQQKLKAEVLKFYEIINDDDESMKGIKLNHLTKFENDVSNDKSNKFHHNLHNEDLNRSFRSQNSIHSDNQETRSVKENKTSISKKLIPRNIKYIQFALILLFLLLIATSSINLALKQIRKKLIEDGFKGIYYSTMRANRMSEITFYMEIYEIFFQNLFNASSTDFKSLQNLVQEATDDLQNIQFSLMELDFNIETDLESKDINLNNTFFEFYYMFDDNEINLIATLYDDAIFHFISAATDISNFQVSEDITDSTVIQNNKNKFFIRENGIGIFRENNELIADSYFSIYYDRHKKYLNIFLVLMVIEIVLTILTFGIIIPIAFSVERSSKYVLDLFANISFAQIEQLSVNCEHFIQNFLKDFNEKKEEEDETENEPFTPKDNFNDMMSSNRNLLSLNSLGGQNRQRSRSATKKNDTPKVKDNTQKKELLNVLPLRALGSMPKEISFQEIPNAPRLIFSSEKNVLNEAKKNEDNSNNNRTDYNEEQNILKKEKRQFNFVNSISQRNKFYIVLKICIIAIIFIFYFVFCYLFEHFYDGYIEKSYSHFFAISKRPVYTYFGCTFFFEYLLRTEPYFYDSTLNYFQYSCISPTDTNQFISYRDKIYSNEEFIESSFLKIPSSFDDYANAFKQYSYNDLCSTYYSKNESGNQLHFCNFTQNRLPFDWEWVA